MILIHFAQTPAPPPPLLVGANYFYPASLSHNDLLFNGTYSITRERTGVGGGGGGGGWRVAGGYNRKDPVPS